MWLRHSVLNSRMCLWPQVPVEHACPETFRVLNVLRFSLARANHCQSILIANARLDPEGAALWPDFLIKADKEDKNGGARNESSLPFQDGVRVCLRVFLARRTRVARIPISTLGCFELLIVDDSAVRLLVVCGQMNVCGLCHVKQIPYHAGTFYAPHR
jgi:hypothetical protein